MSSSFGENIRIQLFGQSHSEAVGAVIDGLPAGERVDMEQVQAFLARRAPGGALATPRKEADIPRVLSGIVDGYTCGAPICAVIENTNTRSSDYSMLKDRPRPAHSDYPAFIKYGGYHDIRGGGHFSARLTAPLCFAGAVCLQILARRGIRIGAHIAAIGNVRDALFDPVTGSPELYEAISARSIPVIDESAGEKMRAEIESARAAQDSVGGVVECAAVGLPAGLGEPIFGGVENRLSAVLFGIPAVRGVEFGAGFAAAAMRGSAHNDAYYYDGGEVATRTNRHGGVLGGLTTGMPLLFRAAFKPTPSIAMEQDTVSLSQKQNAKLCIEGRHDPCVALRAVPVVEAAAAVALTDILLG